MATGSLLPPIEETARPSAASPAPPAPPEGEPGKPTIADTRTLMEGNLYHHDLITDDVLKRRHELSIGKNFKASLERANISDNAGAPPLWPRVPELVMPVMFIYGENDRGRTAERAAILGKKYPCLSGYHPHPLYVVCLLGLQARAGAGALRRRSG